MSAQRPENKSSQRRPVSFYRGISGDVETIFLDSDATIRDLKSSVSATDPSRVPPSLLLVLLEDERELLDEEPAHGYDDEDLHTGTVEDESGSATGTSAASSSLHVQTMVGQARGSIHRLTPRSDAGNRVRVGIPAGASNAGDVTMKKSRTEDVAKCDQANADTAPRIAPKVCFYG